MEKIENIIHLYLYQETTQGKLIEINQFQMCKTLKNQEIFEHRISQLKLLLRPLSDMKAYELDHLNSITGSTEYFLNPLVNNYASVTSYLLSSGFDIFRLIETEQAINKLTL